MLELISADLRRLSSRRAVRLGLLALCAWTLGSSIWVGYELATDMRMVPFDHWHQVEHTSRAVAVVAAAVALICGSTSVGADWASRCWRSLLTWEPRRLRLFVARLVAGAVGGWLVFVAAVAVLAFGYLVVHLIGDRAAVDAPAPAWGSLRTWWAGAYLAAWAGVAGMAFAQLTRNTAGGAVLGLGLCVGGEFGVVYLAPSVMPWSIGTNALTLIGFQVMQPEVVQLFEDQELPAGFEHFGTARNWIPLELGTLRPVLLLTGYLVIVVAVAMVVFRRRDVV